MATSPRCSLATARISIAMACRSIKTSLQTKTTPGRKFWEYCQTLFLRFTGYDPDKATEKMAEDIYICLLKKKNFLNQKKLNNKNLTAIQTGLLKIRFGFFVNLLYRISGQKQTAQERMRSWGTLLPQCHSGMGNPWVRPHVRKC